MKKVLFLISLFGAYFCHAQNYQCLQSGVKHYFTNSNGYLRGIRIDSVKTFGDTTVYYPYHTPRGYYSSVTTLDSNGGSWLGSKVLQLNDGKFIFDNLWHDSVIIKTQANLGDSWIFYSDTTSLYYRADLISVDTMAILGTLDSVKTILITAHGPMGIITTDPVDSFRILLSKNFGFVQVFDLYTFPYHTPDLGYTYGLDFYLDYVFQNGNSFYSYAPPSRNLIFSLISLINLTYEQLYQWNVGDVYEYGSCNDLFEHYGSACLPVEKYLMDTIAAISSTSSNINYSYNGWISTYAGPPPPTTSITTSGIYSTSSSSGTLTYGQTLLIDTTLMPEEFNQSTIYYYQPNDSSYCIVNT